MAAETHNTVLLKSSDGLDFVVSDLEASQSMTIKDEIEFVLEDENVFGVQSSAIHLGVRSNILSKVIEYFRGSHASGGDPRWGAEFIDVDHETLCDLILVSYFMCFIMQNLIVHPSSNSLSTPS
jgi:hypothetical protein